MAPVKFTFSPEMAKVVRTVVERPSHNGHISDVLAVDSIMEGVRDAAETFLYGNVLEAKIVMYDKTPIVRMVIRHAGRVYTVDKGEPLKSLLAHMQRLEKLTSPSDRLDIAKALLPLLPQDMVAMKMADIENKASEALLDPKKTGPIHKRLAARRAADKEKLRARIREVFKGHDDLVSEDEVLMLWRETMCAEVMDS